ncbi:hypothetical protein PVK06_024668 [Gossypium arboreum]|uniref:Uncharacterized protein n=1 Tax=Gossypium arboreum TaxID=29729 RepID=A0ABR0PEC5_GOSAR|nr:hypothetical protein PVK06_024668 [Gossypium arboreum]
MVQGEGPSTMVVHREVVGCEGLAPTGCEGRQLVHCGVVGGTIASCHGIARAHRMERLLLATNGGTNDVGDLDGMNV